MAKKTLRNFQVVGALFASPGGAEIAAGDEVRLFLNQVSNPDFPEYIDALAQNPIARVSLVSGGCVVEGTSYTFEYEADDLEGAATQLNVCDVTDATARACCEVLRDALDEEIAARTAADSTLQDNIDAVQDDLDTWDVLELAAAPSNGTTGVKQITTQTVVGTVATGGSMTTTVTAAGMTGSPLTISFNVDAGDIPSVVAAKAAAALSANAVVAALFDVSNIGADYAITNKTPAANDGTRNLAHANGTATGVTPDASATATQAGIAGVTGTAAARVGQHAQWGARVWEAIDTSPNTWREITTVLNSARHDPAITGFTGGGATKLDGLAVTTTHDIGRFEIVDVGGIAYGMELIAGTDAESSPTTVRPDNYGATNPDGSTNNLTWKFRPAATLSAAVLDATTGGNGSPDETKVALYGNGGEFTATLGYNLIDAITGHNFALQADGVLSSPRSAEVPDASGILLLSPAIVAATPTTGFTIDVARYTDQTHYLTPAGTLATGTFNLPTAANSRVGQVIRVHSTEQVTAVTVAVSGGGTINGAALTALAADTSYAFQCVSVVGAGTWIRLQ